MHDVDGADGQFVVERHHHDGMRAGHLERSTVVDLLVMVLGWRGYISLVLESGWTQEQYADRIADMLVHLLLPDVAT